jgi:uncharacterized membrane protein
MARTASRGGWHRARAMMRWAMAIFYAGAGLLHIFAADKFLPIVPDFVPFPRAVVIITGFCEIAGAAALIGVRLRRLAGLMLALYAICVFPANIKHAFAGVHIAGLPDGWWYHAPRLALQPVLVWWALFASGCIDWPLRSEPAGDAATAPDEKSLERRL